MIEGSWMLWPNSFSDNRKSKIQNRKWAGIVAIGIAYVMCGAVIDAQQSKKVSRIGYVTVASRSAISARVEAFRQGMRELGYVEDKNIVIEWRFGEGKQDRLPALVAELVRVKVEIISRGVHINP